jgi:CRISPR-associated protein Cmr4
MSEAANEKTRSYTAYRFVGMTLDPIHVGTGGSRLGRVDNTIVRDPVTKIPKIPGSSLAGVLRTYVAMRQEDDFSQRFIEGKLKPYFPDCAGQGSGDSGHCGEPDCPVCTIFGFAKKGKDGFAGLASFSDMHVLLFPVATQFGPHWITSPMALQTSGIAEHLGVDDLFKEDEGVVYCGSAEKIPDYLNIGWLYLKVNGDGNNRFKELPRHLEKIGAIPPYIVSRICVVSDALFPHIVNSNLEVRTSVAINPATGAAEDGALFTYEALPRSTVLSWEIVCRNPKHFKIDKKEITAVKSPEKIKDTIKEAFPYLEYLGIGGMGSRGMGRLRVLISPILEPGKEAR